MTFNGVRMAMTATEAALYDQQLGGGLRSKMMSVSHQNLPLALFLEYPDLGYAAWSGSTTGRATTAKIIGRSPGTARRILSQLVKEGIVAISGGNRNRVYRAIKGERDDRT